MGKVFARAAYQCVLSEMENREPRSGIGAALLNQAASVGRRLERCLQLVEEGGGSPMSCAASNAVSREAQQEWEIRQLRAEIRQLRQQLAPQVQAVAPVPAVHQPQQQQPAWPAPQHAVGHPPPQAAAPVAVLPTVHEMIVQLANNHPDLIEYETYMTIALDMFPPTGNRSISPWLRAVLKFYFYFCVSIGRCDALDAVAGVGNPAYVPAVQAVPSLSADTLANYVKTCRKALDIVAKALGLLGDPEEQEEARRMLSGEQED